MTLKSWSAAMTDLVEIGDDLVKESQTLQSLFVDVAFGVELLKVRDWSKHHTHTIVRLVVQILEKTYTPTHRLRTWIRSDYRDYNTKYFLYIIQQLAQKQVRYRDRCVTDAWKKWRYCIKKKGSMQIILPKHLYSCSIICRSLCVY